MSISQESNIMRINTAAPIAPIRTFDILNLVKDNDPILHKPTIPFDFVKPQVGTLYLATSLFETMFKHNAIGLTANQVGIPYSVFVIGNQDNKQIFFNPKIISQSNEEDVSPEGCLSYPGLFLKVGRPKIIDIEYQHITGEVRTATFTGLTAKVIHHEMDHILGKTMTDHVGKLSLKLANDRLKKAKKKEARKK